MLTALWMATSPVTDTSTTSLGINNPLVLGPIAAFVFIIFVTETVVPGKAYRREVEENKRLRDLVEQLIPLSEKMVGATEKISQVTVDAVRVMQDVVNYLSRPHDQGRS